MRAYPLSAVVGMDDLVLSLLLAAVAPDIGGVLIRGEKGTAKSTAVRALAALLPELDVVAGCRFSCDPHDPDSGCPDGPHAVSAAGLVRSELGAPHRRPSRLVELPVGATEDRLLGSLDIESALTTGVKAYEPGILAAAHRGVLYVDEVNLLHDHLVDVLLDAAAMGRVHVEREGVSITHAAQFVLAGTMNPEEGELRPQLLDRFGLTVHVAASRDPRVRAEVVRRRMAFDLDPDGFVLKGQDAEQDLADRIVAARERRGDVRLPDAALEQITALCAAFDVDGMRADIVMARTATAHAAWSGRDLVTTQDVRIAARFALPHRRRRDPFDAPGMDEDLLEQVLDQVQQEQQQNDRGDDAGPGPGDEPDDGPGDGGSGDGGPGGSRGPDNGPPNGPGPATPEQRPAQPVSSTTSGDSPGAPQTAQPAAPAQSYRVRTLKVPGLGHGSAGRRSRAITTIGRTIAGQPFSKSEPMFSGLHLSFTLNAAAVHQHSRGRCGPGLILHREDLRMAVREGREGNLVLFCVDASGSMAATRRMAAVKGAVMSLLLDAYQRRDRIGLITFRGSDADLVLHPTGAVEAARPRLDRLPTGGRTPIDAGLRRCNTVISMQRLRDPRRRPLLIVVTDGRHTHGPDPAASAAQLARAGVRSVVVDCEQGPVRLHLARRLAGYLGGELIELEQVRAQALAALVRERAIARPLALADRNV